MEPIKPEIIKTTVEKKEIPSAFKFDDLKTAEDYLKWKKEIARPIRQIVESAMKGIESEKEATGLELADQFLDRFEKNIRRIDSGVKGEETATDPELDKRVESALKMIERIKTAEGSLDIFDMFTNPDSPWDFKTGLYKNQIEPLLDYLAEESLKDEESKRENRTMEQEGSAPSPESAGRQENGVNGEDGDDIPPTSEDAVSSMEHGVEQKEGEPGKPYFSISPFLGGYYKQHIYDKFGANSGRWGKKEENSFKEGETEELESINKRILSGKVRGGQSPLAIPLPYNWTLDHEGLEIDAPAGSYGLKQNQDGIWYLAVKDEGVFNYKLKIGQKKTLGSGEFGKSAEAMGSLSEELTQKIEEIKNSELQPMAKARSLVRFIRDHLEYSNDPEVYKKYISNPEKYFEGIWTEKKTDCYVSNTLAVRALIESGFKARFIGGFYCKEKNEDGSAALGSSSGHAWLEVWDSAGRRWIRLDATPKGDPNMDEEEQEKELSDEGGEGDYGENDEIMSEEELKKKIEEMKNQQSGAKRSSRSLEDMENQRFSDLAGCSEAQAQEFLKALERVREIKNQEGTPISDILKEEWRRIVQENIVSVSTYKGPVRMEEGDRLEDVVSAKIDISSGEYNPTGFERETRIPKMIKQFGGINIYFSFDLSVSMSETDIVSGRSKSDVQRDVALLFVDSLMQCAIINRNESEGGEEVLPIKIMATLASSVGQTKLPLTDKWEPKEQWAFYSALNQLERGGTPTAETLVLIEGAYDQEMKDLKKKGISEDKYPLHYVVELSDGAPDDTDATKQKHRDLVAKKMVVRGFTIGGIPIDETGMLDENGEMLKSFSQIPPILAKDIANQFQKLRPERVE